jgi:aldose 1-epimerase
MDSAPAREMGRFSLSVGPMRAVIRPADGGRVAALWREDPQRDTSGAQGEARGAAGRDEVTIRRVDVLTPMPATGFAPTEWPKAGLYPLLPFSNRVRNARFTHGGRQVALAPHPGAQPHALHGFAHRHPWQATSSGQGRADLRFEHDPNEPGEGWPWAFDARQVFLLDGAGLTHEIAITNRSREPMPAGLGTHPFFATAPGDRVQFTLDGIWEQDDAGCATRLVPLSGRDRLFDHVQSEATRTVFGAGFGGIASIQRRDGTRVVIETGAPLDQIVFHVPPGGASCCIEPVSHVTDAFNLAAEGVAATGLRVLAPGETMRAIVRIGLA